MSHGSCKTEAMRQPILKKYMFLILCMCYVHMYVGMCVPAAGEGARSPGAGVRDGCELPWELNPGRLGEQPGPQRWQPPKLPMSSGWGTEQTVSPTEEGSIPP